jgi:cell division septal protein FtsQ
MATYLDGAFRGRRTTLAGRPLLFRRGHRSRERGRKRLTLRVSHVLAMFALLAGFFIILDKAYLFLLSWDRLMVRTIELDCRRQALRESLGSYLQSRPLGNILFCDISALQGEIRAFAWVKGVRVRKVLPATLKIDIAERTPFAVLEKGGLALVDEDGVVLETPPSGSEGPLPVVRDEGSFRDRFAEKWRAASSCLKSLSPAERNRLAALECSDNGRMTLEFRDDPVRLIVDGTDVRAKLDLFAASRASLEAEFGALEYADLRIDGRIIIRPLDEAAGPPPSKTSKEAE